MHDNSGGDFQRKTYSGDWKCSQCGTAIKELPFEPNPDRIGDLKCRDCHRDSKPPRRQNNNFRERRMFQGNWSCADCNAPITELPFEPRDTSNLRCRDCFRK